MKTTQLIKTSVLILFALFIGVTESMAQEFKARLSVDYHQIVGERSFLLIAAKYKDESGYVPADNLTLNIYRVISEDSLELYGNATTDENGKAEYDLADNKDQEADSSVVLEYVVKIENDAKFKDADKSVDFMHINLMAEIIETDSVPMLTASLTDLSGNPLKKEKLELYVHRLFAPLAIGEGTYKTDRKGKIEVSIEDPLPSMDGMLTIEVRLDDGDYGIVKYIFDAPIGIVAEDLSTFDKRTMWSPANKTPIFLLIFPNIIIFGIWIVIAMLFFNLYKIYKS